MGFLGVPTLAHWIIFMLESSVWIVTNQFCCRDHITLQLDKKSIKGTEDGERSGGRMGGGGGGEAIILNIPSKGGDYSEIFRSTASLQT